MPATILFHKADADGWFSNAVCRKFMPDDALSLGWDYGDPVPDVPPDGPIFMVDISIDSMLADPALRDRIIWIDHHASSIAKWEGEGKPKIDGLRIDGVGACRLCWAWFNDPKYAAGHITVDTDWSKQREGEPLALFLVGLRDVWKHNGTIYEKECNWLNLALIGTAPEDREDTLNILLEGKTKETADLEPLDILLVHGQTIQKYVTVTSTERAERGAMIRWFRGLKFLCLNTTSKGSMVLDAHARKLLAKDLTIDALMVWCVNGKGHVDVSFYHAPGKTDIDLSKIASQYGGGGHRGACGCRVGIETITSWLNL